MAKRSCIGHTMTDLIIFNDASCTIGLILIQLSQETTPYMIHTQLHTPNLQKQARTFRFLDLTCLHSILTCAFQNIIGGLNQGPQI